MKRFLRNAAIYSVTVWLLFWGIDMLLVKGIRQIQVGEYGTHNRLFDGEINAACIVTGSSRAACHFDTPWLTERSGQSWYNLGLDGEQSIVQYAYLAAYMRYNKPPRIIFHNIDPWEYPETYHNEMYVPYLDDLQFYHDLLAADADLWKHRYLPLNKFAGRQKFLAKGVLGLLGVADRFVGSDRVFGFRALDHHQLKTVDMQITWGARKKYVKQMIELCKSRGTEFVFVMTPIVRAQQRRMKGLDNTRAQVHQFCHEQEVMLFDFLDIPLCRDETVFADTIHLNREGVKLFMDTFWETVKAQPELHKLCIESPGTR